ncbi:MAG: hypothetical protein CH6_0239 [Candidatus Kapaibacterium sp.]|nr:MAG: hypothetical protein CH6_0239 [Candidatus Kapabacteria bacterium]
MQEFFSKNEILENFECSAYTLEKMLLMELLKPREVLNGIEFYHLDDIIQALETFININQFGVVDPETIKSKAFEEDAQWTGLED